MTSPNVTPWLRAFNSPLEAGIRALAVLFASYPKRIDLTRLLQLDYLVVHSADVPNGPPSLHPATPLRSGELLVRRNLIEQGINLFMSRGLIDASFSEGGIAYGAGELAARYLTSLTAPYTLRLRERSEWAVQTFEQFTDDELRQFITENLDRWGSEFETINIEREVPEWL